jgi:hypothetical protein
VIFGASRPKSAVTTDGKLPRRGLRWLVLCTDAKGAPLPSELADASPIGRDNSPPDVDGRRCASIWLSGGISCSGGWGEVLRRLKMPLFPEALPDEGFKD